MKKISTIFLLFLFLVSTKKIHAQTFNAGDLMCVGFNADGTDDLSFVALATIPANTNIYLRDDEWDGTAFNTGESWALWNTGATAIPAGAIINFSNVNSITPTVNYGTAATTGNAGLAAGGDAMYVYVGTNENTPTKFITAVMNNTPSGLTTSLNNTGLTEGATALVLQPANVDIAAYKGARSGSDKAGYIALIGNVATNWDSQDGSGDQDKDGITPDVPFSTTAFSFGGGDVLPPSVSSVSVQNLTTIRVVFSENVTQTTAQTIANYTFNPTISITTVAYDEPSKTATLTVSSMVLGKGYSLSINSVKDIAGNTQTTPSVFGGLFYNDYAGGNLAMSELMYNVGTNGDSLEFLEVYNRSNGTIALGGLRFSKGLVGVFPEYILPAKTAISIAADSAAFRRFYGVGAVGQWRSDFLGNGGESVEIQNTLGGIVDSLTYDDAAPWVIEPDGTGPSLEIINPDIDNALASNWRASKTAVGKKFGNIDILASPNVLPVVAQSPEIAFETRSISFAENAATAIINVTLKNANGTPSSVEVDINSNGKATAGTDFTFTKQTITFTGDTAAANRIKTVTFTLTNDALNESDEYFVLDLKTPTNTTIGTNNQIVVFIRDDERKAPNRTNELTLNQLTSYKNGVLTGNSAEIVAYEKNSKRLFIANSVGKKIDIVDFSTPSVPKPIRSINTAASGGINSIAIQNGVIAAAFEGIDPQANGKVLFIDTAGIVLDSVVVGPMPDMIGISPDGKTVMTANEGEPNAAYTVDPEGSVSIIDISGGVRGITQSKVTTVSFAFMNVFKNELKNQEKVRLFGKFKGSNDSTTLAQDFEPEYIAFSSDSKEAYVSLQENNALLVIDVEKKAVKMSPAPDNKPFILPLGLKDHSLLNNGLDASDQSTEVNITNWNVKGMYMPDAIATFRANNKEYIVTANEGDARDYTGLAEETSLANVRLDALKFPDSTILRGNTQLGRLIISGATGDTDGDGDFDELHTFGTRSFSIRDDKGQLVWDSGDLLERITKDSVYFNASNGAAATKKARSRSKGPEPEGVTIATIGSRIYAFVTLERTGGVVVFNITDPTSPTFVTYINNRKGNVDDDRAPEGIIFIDAKDSPNGKALLITANETSNTLAIYEVAPNFNVSTKEAVVLEDYTVYPNPAQNILYFSREMTGRIFNTTGQQIMGFNRQTNVDISTLQNGVYLLVADGFMTRKVMVQR